MRHRAGAAAALLSLAVVMAGIVGGVRVAGGADSYGYVSQAHLWAHGTLTVEQPLVRELADLVPREALAPLGYRPAPNTDANVPVYAPGLPMLMGAVERLAGTGAMFAVVPLLGGLGVWATYILGRQIGGAAVGLAAAVLLATSPGYLSQLMLPESDVPVTAWWTICLALVSRHSRRAALMAGLAAMAAILTRPNLVPLAAVPGLWLIWRSANGGSRAVMLRVAIFALATIPACLIVAALNAFWYGSPLNSGYGTLRELFAWKYLVPNLRRYPEWLVRSMTPVILLAPAAPALVGRAAAVEHTPGTTASPRSIVWLLWAFAIAVFGCYVFYLPWDDPGFVRFLIPAFPAVVVLSSVSLFSVCGRLPRPLGTVVPIVVVGLVSLRGSVRAVEQDAIHQRVETRYAIAGEYLRQRLPERAVILAMQHSGSARYYSGRITIRYDVIPPGRLDALVHRLDELGYESYVLVDEGEETPFRDRFGAWSPRGLLDWPPLAQLRSPRVNLYGIGDEYVSGDPQVATQPIE